MPPRRCSRASGCWTASTSRSSPPRSSRSARKRVEQPRARAEDEVDGRAGDAGHAGDPVDADRLRRRVAQPRRTTASRIRRRVSSALCARRRCSYRRVATVGHPSHFDLTESVVRREDTLSDRNESDQPTESAGAHRRRRPGRADRRRHARAPRRRVARWSSAGPSSRACRAPPCVSTRSMELLRSWGLEERGPRRRRRRRVGRLGVPRRSPRRPPARRSPSATRRASRARSSARAPRPAWPRTSSSRCCWTTCARCRPARVELGTEVVDVAVERRRACARCCGTSRTGAPRIVRARYLVAADGAHSAVRRALGIAMRGPDRLGRRRHRALPRAAVGRSSATTATASTP